MQDFAQFLAVLLSLSDFGLSANPKAPAPAEVIRYGADGAELFFYIDVEAVLPRTHRALIALPDKPAIKAAPKAKEAIDAAVSAVELARTSAIAATGLDPVKDVKSIALWIDLDGAEPAGLIAVRGSFPADWPDKVREVGEVIEIDGRKAVRLGDALGGVTDGGQLLFGTPALVEPRLKKGWKPPAAKAGSALALARQALSEKPISTIVLVPSPRTIELARAGTGDEALPMAFLTGQRHSIFSLHHDGVSWTYAASSDEAYRTAVHATEGAIELLRSGHHFTRGFARVLLAGLRAHADRVPEVAAVVAREKELLALVSEASGNGRFSAPIRRQAGKRTVSVRARGRRLSDVIPLAGVLPLAGTGAMLWLRSAKALPPQAEESAPPVAAPAPTPAPPAKGPLDVRGAYQRALERHQAR